MAQSTAASPLTPPPLAAPAGRIGRGRALLFAGAVVVLWGISFPVSRVALRELPPLALATGRFALATALLWPAARRRGLRLARADVPIVWLLGLLGVALYFALENYGLVFTTASHASLIVATVPPASAAVEAIRRRRLPRPAAVAGMLMATAGVAVIVRPEGGGHQALLGDLLVLGAMASWIGYTFLARDLMARVPPLLVTAAIMGAGAATLAPMALVEAWFHPLHLPSALGWAALAYLGALCSATAYLLWNLALPVLGVPVTNNFLNAVPLVAVTTGVLVLGEPFTVSLALGGALVMAGVVAVERAGASPLSAAAGRRRGR